MPSGKRAPILGEEILTLEKHAPVLGQIIPTWEYRASDFRHTIPTPEKSDPILGEEIPTSENYPSDLGQEIPLSEYLLPDFRQAFGLTRGQALCYLTNTKALFLSFYFQFSGLVNLWPLGRVTSSGSIDCTNLAL